MDRRDSNYFQKEVFMILVEELAHRYYKKGKFGKSIGFQKFEHADTEPLRLFLGISAVKWDKMKSIQISQMEEALGRSRFKLSLVEFVEAFRGHPLQLESVLQQEREIQFQKFVQLVLDIDILFQNGLTSSQWEIWFCQQLQDLTCFSVVAKALHNLPIEFTRLPVFAYQITGNPHGFDSSEKTGKLLLQVMENLISEKIEDDGILGTMYFERTPSCVGQNLSEVEKQANILSYFKLLRDDIMNFVAIRGFLADNKRGSSAMWKAACDECCSWNVPLKELLQMREIYPAVGKKVLLVENAGVYSILMDRFPRIPIVCTNGQFRYAVWVLLRKLVAFDCEIFYAGDMDPDGIGMAQKILSIFPNHVQLYAMDVDLYVNSLGILIEDVNWESKVKNIAHPAIIDLAKEMLRLRKKVYQEGLLDVLIRRISKDFL